MLPWIKRWNDTKDYANYAKSCSVVSQGGGRRYSRPWRPNFAPIFEPNFQSSKLNFDEEEKFKRRFLPSNLHWNYSEHEPPRLMMVCECRNWILGCCTILFLKKLNFVTVESLLHSTWNHFYFAVMPTCTKLIGSNGNSVVRSVRI